MVKRQKLATLAAVVVIAVLALGFGKIYVVRDDSGGDILWSANEAYLFMDVHRRGVCVSYLEYPWALLKELLNGVRSPDNQRTSVTAVRVTPSKVEQHVVEMLDERSGNTPTLYKVFKDNIYANCEEYVCKWNGNNFERVTEEEQRHFDTAKDNGDWSQREFAQAVGDYQFAVDVGKTFRLEVANKLLDRGGHSLVSVDVVRAGQAPESIWHLDGRSRRVSKTEYENMFKR